MIEETRIESAPVRNSVAAFKEGPILFTGPMVRAIFNDLKWQTRRTRGLDRINENPDDWEFCALNGYGNFVFSSRSNSSLYLEIKCPYGEVADHLWVRETFYVDLLGYSERERLPRQRPPEIEDEHLYYRADGECCQQIAECACAEVGKPKWRPSIFMPRWASRLKLENLNIGVERVASISEEDAIAEGVEMAWEGRENGRRAQIENSSYRVGYKIAWNNINAKRGLGWKLNPWVWAITFRKV